MRVRRVTGGTGRLGVFSSLQIRAVTRATFCIGSLENVLTVTFVLIPGRRDTGVRVARVAGEAVLFADIGFQIRAVTGLTRIGFSGLSHSSSMAILRPSRLMRVVGMTLRTAHTRQAPFVVIAVAEASAAFLALLQYRLLMYRCLPINDVRVTLVTLRATHTTAASLKVRPVTSRA
jgi:hypothetical protein